METFPGPNFFYMAKLRRPSASEGLRQVSPCAGATNHRPSSP